MRNAFTKSAALLLIVAIFGLLTLPGCSETQTEAPATELPEPVTTLPDITEEPTWEPEIDFSDFTDVETTTAPATEEPLVTTPPTTQPAPTEPPTEPDTETPTQLEETEPTTTAATPSYGEDGYNNQIVRP